MQDGDRSEVIHADREKYSRQIKELLSNHKKDFVSISGFYQERYETAVSLVNQLFAVKAAY